MYQIDFFELCFLAEACIPPQPIARSMFWQDLSDKHYHKMTEQERGKMFQWLNQNYAYQQSLKENKDTQNFHNRFDPSNQFIVHTSYKGKQEQYRAYKRGDKYHTSSNTHIAPQYITNIEHLVLDKE